MVGCALACKRPQNEGTHVTDVTHVKGNVEVDGQPATISLGLHRADALCEALGKVALFLVRPGRAPTPLSSADHVLLRGGEQLASESPSPEESGATDNPPLSPALRPILNGQSIEVTHPKATGFSIKANDAALSDGRLFVESVDGVDVEIPDDLTIVVQEEDVYFVVPQSPEGGMEIDVEECGKHERRPPRGHKYRIRIDGTKHTVETAAITGAEILALVEKNDHDWSLNQKLHGGRRVRVRPEQEVDLCTPGAERFETVRRQAQQGHG